MKWLVRVLIGLIGSVSRYIGCSKAPEQVWALMPSWHLDVTKVGSAASTMTKYLTFLGRKLGETVTPQAVN